MRGFVLYMRYIVVPAIVIVAVLWGAYIVGRTVKRISRKNDMRNRRQP